MGDKNTIGGRDLATAMGQVFLLSMKLTSYLEVADFRYYNRNRGVKEYREWETAEEHLDNLLTRLYELKRQLCETTKSPKAKPLANIV